MNLFAGPFFGCLSSNKLLAPSCLILKKTSPSWKERECPSSCQSFKKHFHGLVLFLCGLNCVYYAWQPWQHEIVGITCTYSVSTMLAIKLWAYLQHENNSLTDEIISTLSNNKDNPSWIMKFLLCWNAEKITIFLRQFIIHCLRNFSVGMFCTGMKTCLKPWKKECCVLRCHTSTIDWL